MEKPMPKAHAKFSASGAKRWLSCPGSVALSETAPPSIESEYAKEGTKAHAVLEEILRSKNWGEALKDQAELFGTPKEILEPVEIAVHEIGRRLNVAPNAEFLIEEKVDLSFIEPGTFGTCDVGIVEEFGRLTVIDYKHGAGIPVDPEDNPQAIFYALGLAHKYDYNFSEICIVIIQPRAKDEDAVKEWVTTVDRLLEWKEIFRKGIADCKDPLATFSQGEWCRFCPAASICPEVSSKALEQAQIDFAPDTGALAIPEPKNLSLPNLSEALNAAEKLEFWISELRKVAFNRLNSGEIVEGFKLVEKRSTRHWLHPESTATMAKHLFGVDAFTEPELKSPKQLEKIAGPTWVAKRVTNVSSGVTLARDTDKRPAVTKAQLDFSEVEEFDPNNLEHQKIVERTKKTLDKVLEKHKEKMYLKEEGKTNGKTKPKIRKPKIKSNRRPARR